MRMVNRSTVAPAPALVDRVPLEGRVPGAVSRPRISKPLTSGVRAIDALLTCGQGQRMGIFAGAGAWAKAFCWE